MNPETERDVLGENLRRALSSAQEQKDRSYAEFLRRVEGGAAAPKRPTPGLMTLAASLLVCAGVLIVILSSGGAPSDPTESPGATTPQDEKVKKPAPGSEEQSLRDQIGLQEKILERTADEKERALVAATILNLKGQLARLKKGGPNPMDELNARLKEKPDDVEALVSRAEIELKMKKWDEALADGRKAAALAPENAKAHFVIGRACQVLKQPEEADREFARALALDPGLKGPYQEFTKPPPPKAKGDGADDRAAKLRAEIDAVNGKLKTATDPDAKAALEMRIQELGQELKLLEQGKPKEAAPKEMDVKKGPAKEPPKSPKDVERQIASLSERLAELKAMEANADLSAEERAKAGKEAARVQGEIEKLKAEKKR